MFEGTPQELKEVKHFGLFDFNQAAAAIDSAKEEKQVIDHKELTEEIVKEFFTRGNGMTSDQKAVMKCIYRDAKGGIDSLNISKITGIPQERVKATMRSFGKRATHTKNWPSRLSVFEQTWTGLKNIYRMRPVMRDAFERNIVKV